jgi:hypothetical protein
MTGRKFGASFADKRQTKSRFCAAFRRSTQVKPLGKNVCFSLLFFPKAKRSSLAAQIHTLTRNDNSNGKLAVNQNKS